jgi:putative restriction endonuclease
VLHVLDAAHIRPYAQEGTHKPQNGILLRQDLHTLFDRGYVTVKPDYRIQVSQRIEEEFDNGQEYYSLQGSQIGLPDEKEFRPDPVVLDWHNNNVFRG